MDNTGGREPSPGAFVGIERAFVPPPKVHAVVLRLTPRAEPLYPADAAAHFGHLAAAPGESEPEDARAFLTERETEPYSPALDARFQVIIRMTEQCLHPG